MHNSAPTRDLRAVLAKPRLPALDGIRAVAVGLVIAVHAGAPVPGDLGVSLFFVLSGFLITWLLLLEHQETGAVSLRAFYFRRFLRIVPAYAVFLALSWTADTLLGSPWPPHLATAALTYTVNYWNIWIGHHHGTIGHAWSLSVEEQFYLCWPPLFIWAAARKRLRETLGIAIVGVVLWRSLAVGLFSRPDVYVYNAFETRADQLAVGCGLAVMAHLGSLDRFSRWVTRWWWLPVGTAVLIYWSRTASTEWHSTAGYTVEAALIAVLLVQLLVLAAHPCWQWLDSGPLRYLGALSYPLYLYHQWGLDLGRHAAPVRALRIPFGLLGCVALAAGSYYLVERPASALRRGRSSRRRATGTAELPPSAESGAELS